MAENARSYKTLVDELKVICVMEKTQGALFSKLAVMAEALGWALQTARTSQQLEQDLLTVKDLRARVQALANGWDGEHFISGAHRSAEEQIRTLEVPGNGSV
jgi:hypothetical protein